MPHPVAVLAVILALSAAPAAAADEPVELVGIYAGSPESCRHYLADDYVVVERDMVSLKAVGYGIERWRRDGDGWIGDGTVASEGEGPEENQPGSIRLRKLPDGGLEIDGQTRVIPCPAPADEP